MAEMPELAALYRDAEGLELIAVNDEDTADQIRKFVEAQKYPFLVAMDEARVAETYKVKGEGHPITYLIRPDRSIAYVQIGYDTEKKLAQLEQELARLGITRQPPK